MSKPKASRVSWTHLFLSHIHPIASFLQNAFWPEPFITFPYHYRLGSSQPSLGLLYTVFLNDLFPPFTTLKAILLKSKCAVELTSPKERSGLCLGYSEVMCHVRQKCPCSGQGVWVTQYRQTWNLKFTSMDHQSRPCNEAPIQILWTPKLEWVPWLATPCAVTPQYWERNTSWLHRREPEALQWNPSRFSAVPFWSVSFLCNKPKLLGQQLSASSVSLSSKLLKLRVVLRNPWTCSWCQKGAQS